MQGRLIRAVSPLGLEGNMRRLYGPYVHFQRAKRPHVTESLGGETSTCMGQIVQGAKRPGGGKRRGGKRP